MVRNWVIGACFFVATRAPAQAPATGLKMEWQVDDNGATAIVPMSNAPFPHASRQNGFKGSSRQFPRDPHYTDSSVALFVPRGYRKSASADVLVYLHGHMGELRRSMARHRIREMVAASGKNVVLIFPQGPKNAADSGCGKLEDPGGLQRLVEEAAARLHADGKTGGTAIGRLAIAGHSGAYRGISFCIEHGGCAGKLADVGLLDASYGRLDAFVAWRTKQRSGRLFSVFTDHLAKENVYLMTHLRQHGIDYELRAESDVDAATMAKAPVLFVHAEKSSHDATVAQLEPWLKSRSFANVDDVGQRPRAN